MSDALADKPRLLSKMIPAVNAQVVDGVVTLIPPDQGWDDSIYCNGYPTTGYKRIIGYSTFIDLAGYKQSDLTFVVTGVNIANSAPPTAAGEGFVVTFST